MPRLLVAGFLTSPSHAVNRLFEGTGGKGGREGSCGADDAGRFERCGERTPADCGFDCNRSGTPLLRAISSSSTASCLRPESSSVERTRSSGEFSLFGQIEAELGEVAEVFVLKVVDADSP